MSINSIPYILIIDDNVAIKEALTWTLEFEGYTVVTANNGQEALQYIEDNSIPSVILLDLMMPIMNGFEFHEIYARMPALSAIPIVVMSASREVELKIKLLPNEFFLEKPFDIKLLLEFIKKSTSIQ